MGLLFTTVKNETINKSPERIILEEKRAPTDESIRIYHEYEDKLRSEIAEKLMVKNNLITYSLAFCNFDNLNPYVYVKFMINGEEHSEKIRINSFDAACPEKIANHIKEWLVDKMTMKPIIDIFNSYYSGKTSGYRIIDCNC